MVSSFYKRFLKYSFKGIDHRNTTQQPIHTPTYHDGDEESKQEPSENRVTFGDQGLVFYILWFFSTSTFNSVNYYYILRYQSYIDRRSETKSPFESNP